MVNIFNEIHDVTINKNTMSLSFIRSQSVQAFPCGRRRSTRRSDEDDSRIPFDPEARLNTEANNRKHSSLNGYTQTYLKSWNDTEKLLTFALGGYLFDVNLGDDYSKAFGNVFADEATSIYANILIDKTQLFVGTYEETALAYYTGVLGSWTSENLKDNSALDLRTSENNGSNEFDNYYFSGLAFSDKPVATISRANSNFQTRDEYEYNIIDEDTKEILATKKIISLCILDKVDGIWKLHEPAKLPFIEHGVNPNSIVVGDTLIKSTPDNLGDLTVEGKVLTPELQVSALLKVHNDNNTAEAAIDEATIKEATVHTLTVPYGTVDNTRIDTSGLYSPYVSVNKLKATTEVKAPALYQTIDNRNMQVPVIELDDLGNNTYQLKISRIGSKSTN